MSLKEFIIDIDVDTILCDIEGTTTLISFVKEVLFPYVRENLRNFLTEKFDDAECKEDIKLLIQQFEEDFENEKYKNEVPKILKDGSKQELIDSIVKNVYWQMDMDRKAKPLKQLQGHIWKSAYITGSIKGHVYDDVVPMFEKVTQKGLKIYIYSSGSVQAQELLFGYSKYGNLLNFISGHFDTSIGTKDQPESYSRILSSLGKTGNQVLFLTDVIKEAEAAEKTGMKVCLVRRADNPDKETKMFQWIHSFDEVKLG